VSSNTWVGGSPGSDSSKFDTIGARSDGSNFTIGKLSQLSGFNSAFTSSQVAALYNSGTPANVMALSTKPKAYYPLGEQAQMGYSNWNFPNGSLQSHVVDFDGTVGEIALTSDYSIFMD
jgi:hypothetical protein